MVIKIGFIFSKTPQHAYAESVELAPGQIDRSNQYIGSRITSHLVLKLEDGEASQKIALENSSVLTDYISNLEAIDLPPDSIKDDGMSFQEGESEMWRQRWDAVKEFISSGKVVGAVFTALGAAVSIIQLAAWIKAQRITV
ncbi:hypothetical protein BGW38_004598 [Lunasporangiospora selenospora]|uniref:Uncharacterized protein n=1 Tax=Lunasporangiospora selenospora TaxID=979761 RepID=A0A9P6KHI1_9FUNG|nr:hypothetical protein BGW38_004598 [Lunasporangiospora selenospora]